MSKRNPPGTNTSAHKNPGRTSSCSSTRDLWGVTRVGGVLRGCVGRGDDCGSRPLRPCPLGRVAQHLVGSVYGLCHFLGLVPQPTSESVRVPHLDQRLPGAANLVRPGIRRYTKDVVVGSCIRHRQQSQSYEQPSRRTAFFASGWRASGEVLTSDTRTGTP